MSNQKISAVLIMIIALTMLLPAWAGAQDDKTERIIAQHTINLGAGQSGEAVLKGSQVDPGSLFMQNLLLTVNMADQNITEISLPAAYNGGYECSLAADDFTGDQRDEIVVSMPTGGSGGVINYLIYTFKSGKWQLIYSPVYPGEIKMNGKYLNNYKVQLNLQGIKKPIILNLASRKDSLEEMGIYKNGRLKEQVLPWINADIMEITDYDRDGIQEVRAHSTINGTCNADDIASVWSIWKYEKGRWVRHGLTCNIIK